MNKFRLALDAALLVAAIAGLSFGIHGAMLASEAANRDAPTTENEVLPIVQSDIYSGWQIFNEVGLHYDKLEPLDLECQNVYLEQDERGGIKVRETISLYANKWGEEIFGGAAERAEAVARSQEKWEAFTKENAFLDDLVRNWDYFGGTGPSYYRVAFDYDNNRARALYLKSLYESIN